LRVGSFRLRFLRLGGVIQTIWRWYQRCRQDRALFPQESAEMDRKFTDVQRVTRSLAVRTGWSPFQAQSGIGSLTPLGYYVTFSRSYPVRGLLLLASRLRSTAGFPGTVGALPYARAAATIWDGTIKQLPDGRKYRNSGEFSFTRYFPFKVIEQFGSYKSCENLTNSRSSFFPIDVFPM